MADFSDFYPPAEGGGGLTYQVIAAGITVLADNGYYVDTSTLAISLTLPTAAPDDSRVFIGDGTGDAETNNITITPPAGETIMGAATFTINVAWQMFEFVKVDTDWKFSGGVGEGAGGGAPGEGVDLAADYVWTGSHTFTEDTEFGGAVRAQSGGLFLVGRDNVTIRSNLGDGSGIVKAWNFGVDGITTFPVNADGVGWEIQAQNIVCDIVPKGLETASTSSMRMRKTHNGVPEERGFVGLYTGGGDTQGVSAIIGCNEWNSGTRLIVRDHVDSTVDPQPPRSDAMGLQMSVGGTINFGSLPEGTYGIGNSSLLTSIQLGSNGLISTTNDVFIVADSNGVPKVWGFKADGTLIDPTGNVMVNSTKVLDLANEIADQIEAQLAVTIDRVALANSMGV